MPEKQKRYLGRLQLFETEQEKELEKLVLVRGGVIRIAPEEALSEISLDMVQTYQDAGGGRIQEVQTTDAVDRETLTRLSVERYPAEGAEFQGMLMISSFPAIDRIFMYRVPVRQFDQDALKELNQALRWELDRLLRSK